CWRRRASGSSGCSPNSGPSVPERGAGGKIVAGRASAVFDPYELLGALQARRVSFVVIGAFARVVHGTRELTEGIDITPSMREDNLAALEVALQDLAAHRADG